MRPLITLWLRQRKGFVVGWSIAVIILVTALLAIYPSIREQANTLNQTLQQLPEALRSLKANNADLLSPAGYLNSQLYYATLPLLLGIMSISLFGSLLARDEQDHTIELLLARPVSRTKLLFSKLIAGTAILAWVSLVALATTLIVGNIVQLEVAAPKIALATLYVFLLCLAFGVVAFMLTAIGGRPRRLKVAIATVFAFGGYLIASLAGLVEWLAVPAKLLPYYHFKPYDILHGQISVTLTAYLLIVIGVASLVAWVSFRRRDLD